VDFAFSEEQEMLRAAARSWLSGRYPTEQVARLADSDTGWDPASWRQLGALGWLDPDLGMLEYAVLAEESGYALYPGPWWSSVALAAPVLGAVPERPTTLAWAERGTTDLRSAAVSAATTARQRAGVWRLTGSKQQVPDLAQSEAVLVVAAGPDGIGVWQVAVDAATVCPVSTMDTTRRFADLRLEDIEAELVLAPGAAEDALHAVRLRATALLACEAVGIAQHALDLSSAHARERTQFGRPIGTFQGVSHRIADIYTALQLGRSLAYRAAWSVAAAAADAEEAVTVAVLSAGEGAVLACENAIQAMGGIGFTWDHSLHRFYKRAQWITAFDGTGRSRREELATVLLGTG